LGMKKENNMLTEKEKMRLEKFEKISDDMQMKEFKRQDLTIDLKKANVLSLVLFIFLFVAGKALYYLVNQKLVFSDINPLSFLIIFIVLIVVHEMIHGACWVAFTHGSFKNVEFGILKPTFTPYCTCLVPLKKGQYIVGAMMPGLLLGVIPFIISIIVANPSMLIIAETMIAAAAGDMMILLKIIGYKSSASEVMYMDHPTEAGGVIFEK